MLKNICRLIVCAAMSVLLTAGCNSSDFSMGVDAYQREDYANAVKYFQKCILANTTSPDGYVYQGMCYLEMEAYEKADNDFHLALNLENDEVMAYRGLGLSAYARKDYSSAADYFQQALKYSRRKDIRTYDILHYLLNVYMDLKYYDEAIEICDQLLLSEGDRAINYYMRGTALLEKNEYQQACADYDEALKDEDANYPLYWNIYTNLETAGYDDLAEGYLGRALELENDGTQESYKYKGIIEYLKRDYSSAIQDLESADQQDMQRNQFLALAYEMSGDKKKAEEFYTQWLENSRNVPEVYNYVAQYRVRNREYKKALKCLQEGIETFDITEGKELYYNEITVYEYLGDYSKAYDNMLKYVEVYGASTLSDHEIAYLKTKLKGD